MTNNFKFSIILSLFESQTYLKETINSIINQTLDFKKNTQIIFVDNESLDDSKTIIEEYKEKYPENIKILYKKNEGVASSRNFALKHIEGEYVNFIEANDTLSKNALKEVFGFFNENKNEVDVVNIPVSIFNKEFSKYLFDYDLNQKKVIHLNKNPQKTNLTFYSSFIKKEHIQNSRFDTDLANSSEKLVLCRILLNKHTYGSVNTCTYHFRQRNSDNRFIENTITNRDLTEKFKFFFIPLIKSSKNDDAQVPEFIQHIVAY